MSFNINEFKSQLVGGGARNSLFKVQITNPITGISDFKMPFMIKAASIPSSEIGSYEVPYYGRTIKYGGDRRFSDWNVTVINDEDFTIRNGMETWSNAINSHATNTRALPRDYKAQGQVTQYGKNGAILRVYNFEGLFPVAISEINLAWASENEIEEFQVVFQFDLWRVSGGITGNSTT